jgi:hypothetical protein
MKQYNPNKHPAMKRPHSVEETTPLRFKMNLRKRETLKKPAYFSRLAQKNDKIDEKDLIYCVKCGDDTHRDNFSRDQLKKKGDKYCTKHASASGYNADAATKLERYCTGCHKYYDASAFTDYQLNQKWGSYCKKHEMTNSERNAPPTDEISVRSEGHSVDEDDDDSKRKRVKRKRVKRKRVKRKSLQERNTRVTTSQLARHQQRLWVMIW